MTARMLVVFTLGLVSLLVAACGGGAPVIATPSGGASEAPAATSAAGQPAGAPTQSAEVAPASSSGLDLETFDLCAVLPRAELAALAGGTPYEADEPPGPLCIYTIDPGDGTAALYSLAIFEPELIQAMVDYVRENEQVEWIEGIGDTAYLQPAEFGEGYDLNVVVEGGYGLTISGPDGEVLQAAARLIVERLGP